MRVSRVDGPCLLYGSVGVWLSVALQYVGLFEKGDDRLLSVLLKPVFHGEMPDVLPFYLQILMTAVFCYGLAFVVLDTAGTLKRVLMGVTVFVLSVAMVPTLAVWGIYFSPFLPVVGIFWSWFCCMMHVNHHLMPCEVSPPTGQTPNHQPKTSTPTATPKTKVATVPPVDVKKKAPVVDVDQKYKPKEKVDG